METQKNLQKAIYPGSTLDPAEGRVDVAENVEEEQRNAYFAHHKVALAQGKDVASKDESGSVSLSDFNQAALPPVEGREDIASNLEEEQQNAYSTHRA